MTQPHIIWLIGLPWNPSNPWRPKCNHMLPDGAFWDFIAKPANRPTLRRHCLGGEVTTPTLTHGLFERCFLIIFLNCRRVGYSTLRWI